MKKSLKELRKEFGEQLEGVVREYISLKGIEVPVMYSTNDVEVLIRIYNSRFDRETEMKVSTSFSGALKYMVSSFLPVEEQRISEDRINQLNFLLDRAKELKDDTKEASIFKIIAVLNKLLNEGECVEVEIGGENKQLKPFEQASYLVSQLTFGAKSSQLSQLIFKKVFPCGIAARKQEVNEVYAAMNSQSQCSPL